MNVHRRNSRSGSMDGADMSDIPTKPGMHIRTAHGNGSSIVNDGIDAGLQSPKLHPPPGAPDSKPRGDIAAADAHLWTRDLAIFVGCGVVGLVLLLAVLAFVLKDLNEEQLSNVVLPTNLDKAKQLGAVLSEYTSQHYTRVLFGHACVYIYLQTFAIPGTVFANLLAGALFGMYIGFPLCLFYNTIGSVFLYLFSRLLGRRLVARFFSDRMVTFRRLIAENRHQLTFYMIFARIFPFTPNWFMNVASPQLHVPMGKFSIGVAIGLIPYNFLSCKAGLLLASLRSKSDIIDTSTTVQLAIVAVLGFLAPMAYKRYLNRKSLQREEQARQREEVGMERGGGW